MSNAWMPRLLLAWAILAHGASGAAEREGEIETGVFTSCRSISAGDGFAPFRDIYCDECLSKEWSTRGDCRYVGIPFLQISKDQSAQVANEKFMENFEKVTTGGVQRKWKMDFTEAEYEGGWAELQAKVEQKMGGNTNSPFVFENGVPKKYELMTSAVLLNAIKSKELLKPYGYKVEKGRAVPEANWHCFSRDGTSGVFSGKNGNLESSRAIPIGKTYDQSGNKVQGVDKVGNAIYGYGRKGKTAYRNLQDPISNAGEKYDYTNVQSPTKYRGSSIIKFNRCLREQFVRNNWDSYERLVRDTRLRAEKAKREKQQKLAEQKKEQAKNDEQLKKLAIQKAAREQIQKAASEQKDKNSNQNKWHFMNTKCSAVLQMYPLSAESTQCVKIGDKFAPETGKNWTPQMKQEAKKACCAKPNCGWLADGDNQESSDNVKAFREGLKGKCFSTEGTTYGTNYCGGQKASGHTHATSGLQPAISKNGQADKCDDFMIKNIENAINLHTPECESALSDDARLKRLAIDPKATKCKDTLESDMYTFCYITGPDRIADDGWERSFVCYQKCVELYCSQLTDMLSGKLIYMV